MLRIRMEMYICFFQTQIFLIDFEIVARWEKEGERSEERERETRQFLRFAFHVTMFITGITNKTNELFYAFDILYLV